MLDLMNAASPPSDKHLDQNIPSWTLKIHRSTKLLGVMDVALKRSLICIMAPWLDGSAGPRTEEAPPWHPLTQRSVSCRGRFQSPNHLLCKVLRAAGCTD